ncbi:N-acetyl-gamma-glutamyl-phosphate reductase [Parablautia intestinalis]|uniref:N-acetyl-gamma-glutamyl-phosphate reductase n=1 Tax=Parablautia intestinalis TaxID=2320100 RepID=A0A3A9AAZ0_9FIRM|nr:N-acetyl-gamma-glutamyl-phosphate reductase [Parablautia intestinalis]RKI88609.1 N-acetyl-gamma-glutamyl-phosphate reductase [Parablautia intestinalis]
MEKTKIKIFIDGSEGTTGLRIHERFSGRDDIALISIEPDKRKDIEERKRLINQSDITFLCLPDAAAREAVGLVDNTQVKIIDTSTAHRTEEGWAYGFPELSVQHRKNIKEGKRIAVPGCHATGFISLVYPIVAEKILPADYPVSAFSLTGYSGGGKKMIAEYEADKRAKEYDAPREYALSQKHKHLKEMKKVTGLTREPLFSPIVADYYSGMVVSVPLYGDYLKEETTPKKLHEFFADFYKDQKFIKVMPFGSEDGLKGMMAGNGCSGWDGLRIFVTGNEERVLLTAQFDNLGKGASGAAVQCLNIMLGCGEDKGLNL